ncbi:TonB-dependent receptor plug domain-containing protein [uncultured Muriicola sp.]|uniref:TonB-dependent receptor n=1 Tax=uncultured Muriicola sp. TaxID=1583102 RepID=UPI002607DF51|nr:TonB-dependent receptor plug domain-containing protein [uncultured Muriicola sp.]
MKSNLRKFLLLLVAISSFSAFTQETKEPRPLINILEEVSDNYGYRFNYAISTIQNIVLTPPDKQLSIEEVLHYLSEKTGLAYSILPNKFITIKKAHIFLCGYLKDKDTQKSLPFATIRSNRSSTISDENGYFEISVQGISDLLTIRYLGYKNLQRQARFFTSGNCADIYLVAQQQQLPEIVLYDYLIRGIDQLNNGSYQIDFSRFSILPGLTETDVLQSVQALPGIQSINETVSDINIRGGTNDQNLLLWDDIKMYQSGHFFGLISMFNPMITKNVSLRKNGTPASYTDGVSGTIAMETDEALTEQPTGSLGVNFIDFSGFLDTPIGKRSSLQLAARKAISDFVETPTYSEYFSRISQDTEVETNAANIINSDQTFDFYDASLRWLWHPSDKDQVRVNFIHASNTLQFNENSTVNSADVRRESSLTQNTMGAGLKYRRNWNQTFNTTIHLYNTDYELRAINANIQNDQRFLQENKVSETGARFTAGYTINDWLHWTNGYQFIETKVTNLDDVDNPIFIRLNGDVLRIHSGFTELGYSSKNRSTNANLGLRTNYLDKFGRWLWEPRLSLNHRFLKWMTLQILGEYKHQNTSQIINFQNDFLGVEKRRWQLSNDADVPVIEGKQASVGLSFNKKGWLLNAVGYMKEVEGITAQSQGFQNQYEFQKAVGSYKASGIDLLIRKQFKGTSTWLSYSYLNADYTFDTFSEVSFPSNYDITHAVTLGASYELGQVKIAAGWNWHSGRPATATDATNPVVNNQVNFGPSNSDRLPDYMRVDLSAIYQFSISHQSKAQLGFSIWNLLDRENYINNYYRPETTGGVREFLQPSLGITPNVVLRAFF